MNDFLTIFLSFRLFDNALIKIYSLYGRGSDKITFKKIKICGVIVSKSILLMKTKGPFVELKNELIILSFIFFLHYGSQKSKIFKNVLENVLRQQICL